MREWSFSKCWRRRERWSRVQEFDGFCTSAKSDLPNISSRIYELVIISVHRGSHNYFLSMLFLGSSLAVDQCMKYAIQFDNESLYRFAPNGLSPSYWHVNLLISYTISGITARTRFDGDLGCDMSDIETNLCPYPSLNFLFATYSPLRFGKRTCNEKALTTESFSNIYFHLNINNLYLHVG